MGGLNKWVGTVEDAIDAFIDREYPKNSLAQGLTVIPDLGMDNNSKYLHSPQAQLGGLVTDELLQNLR